MSESENPVGSVGVGSVVFGPMPTYRADRQTVPMPVTDPMWKDAAKEFPDADIAVLAVNAHHDAYWIATWDGETWASVDTMQVVRVTHWMDLPQAPVISPA
jgi:hypothetical protein